LPSWLPLFNVYIDFVEDNNLKLTNINRLTDVFTYCNDTGTATSWIDHVVCSTLWFKKTGLLLNLQTAAQNMTNISNFWFRES